MPQFTSPYLNEEAPGVWRGATTFEEFRGNVGDASWPSVLIGAAGNQNIQDEDPDLEAISIGQTSTNSGNAWYTIFNDMFQFGEILVRFYIDAYASGSRVKMGVGPIGEFSLDGTEVQVHVFSNTVRSNIIRKSDGVAVGAGINHGDLDPGSGLPYWLWCRVRIDDAGGGNLRVRYRIENGDYNNPPDGLTWDNDATFAGDLIGPWATRLGLWIRSTIGPTQLSDRRVAFYSFTADPVGFPLLLTDDVVNDAGIQQPTILTADPLQGTYVGLQADAFSAIQTQNQGFQVPAVPDVIANNALAAWDYQSFKAAFASDGQRFMPDVSGSGNHLYVGAGSTRDSILAVAPFVGKRGVIHGGNASRALGLVNTAQALNLGNFGGSGQVRITVNLSMDFSFATQSFISFNDGIGNYAFHWQNTGPNSMSIWVTENGSTNRGGAIGAGFANAGFNDWDDMWIRVTYDFDADLTTVETSTDGVSWSVLGTVAFGANLAGMYQVPATGHFEFGAENNGASNVSPGCAIFSVLAEENTGAGYVTAWSFDAATADFSDLDGVTATQGAAGAADPVQGTNSFRFTSHRNTTFHNSNARGVDQQFDVAAGEILTVVEVASLDNADGEQTTINKRLEDAAANAGWGHHVLAGLGATTQISDGVTEDETTPVVIGEDFELVARVYEIDGPAGEIRLREGSGVPQTDAYGDQGSGSPVGGVSVGAYFNGAHLMIGNWLGVAIFKQALTDAEIDEVITYLSGGRL